MRKEYRKLWEILILLWEPLHLAGHTGHRFSRDDRRLVQKVFYLFQWTTIIDLGYRYEFTHSQTRISSHQLIADLLGFEHDPEVDRIQAPKRLLKGVERNALKHFAKLWDELPEPEIISTRKFIAMVARYHYCRHIKRWSLKMVSEDFEQHFSYLGKERMISLQVKRELFLGKIYELANEYHDQSSDRTCKA